MRLQYNWKFISIGFLLIVLIILVILPVYGMELSVGESRHSYSGQVLVPIHLKVEKGESPTCASLDLQYNPNLITFQKIQIEKNLIQQGKIIQAREIKPGLVRILIYGLNENSLLSGNIAIAYFQHQNILLAGTTSLKINKAIGATGKANKLPIQTKTARLNLNSGPTPMNALNNKFSLDLLLLLIVNIFILSNLKGKKSLGTSYPKVFGRRWVDWCNLKTRDRPPPFLTCLPPPLGANGNNCVKPTKCRPSNPPLKPSPFLRNSTLNLIIKSLNKLIKFYIFVALIFSLQWFILPQASTFGATYYCDPVAGDTQNGDGSVDNPWGTLESVIAAGKFGAKRDTGTIKSGDTIKLNAGFHGFASFYDSWPEPQDDVDYITIEPNGNAVAELSQIIFRYCHYYRIKGLRLSPDLATPSKVVYHPTNYEDYAIIDTRYTNHLIIEDCNIFTVMDTSDWAPDKWSYWVWSGIKKSDGVKSSIIRNNVIRNVGSGIYSSSNCLVEGNLIDGFSYDAMKVAGPNSVFQDNRILNCYRHIIPSGYPHADAMQMNAGVNADNITIRRNYICQNTDPNRSMYYANPLTWTLGQTYTGVKYAGGDYVVCNNAQNIPQIYTCYSTHTATDDNKPGIGKNWENYWYNGVGGLQGMFMGSDFTNSLIENNVVIVSNAAWGISMYSAVNTKILNNTVLKPYGFGNWPNIVLTGASGVVSSNAIVRNNIADGFPTADPANNVVVDHNFNIAYDSLKNPTNFDPNVDFVDYMYGDVHLASGSSFIDVGESADAPSEDLDGGARPYGAGFDIGAYEYGARPPLPLKGDVNRDGKVNIQDVQACVNHMLGKQDWGTRADVNGDGKVDNSDIGEIINIILKR